MAPIPGHAARRRLDRALRRRDGGLADPVAGAGRPADAGRGTDTRTWRRF